MKKLLLVALCMCVAPASGAMAQSAIPSIPGLVNTDEIAGAGKGGAGAATSVPASPVFLSGTGPINLRPGAYISHDQQAPSRDATAQGQQSQTSAGSYNAAIDAARKRQKAQSSQAPSPFPPGWAPD